MKRFNPAKAFRQIRTESQKAKEAWAELARRNREQWAAYEQRNRALYNLMEFFPREGAGTLDVGRATKLMIEYAQTLSAKWVKARVEFVSDRLTKLAEDGKPARDARLKEILLNLLLLANAGDDGKVAEIFIEALRGDPNDVETFRLCLINWLVDKVVDRWPPLPDELKPPMDVSVEYRAIEASHHRAGVKELMPGTRPNYATFLTKEQARDGFLAVNVPMPEELAALRPAVYSTMPREEQECLITLAQAAALVHRSKRALEEYKGRGMPKPRVRGGGGKPSLWAYAEIRPWLTKTFDISLPERFFADRNAERS